MRFPTVEEEREWLFYCEQLLKIPLGPPLSFGVDKEFIYRTQPYTVADYIQEHVNGFPPRSRPIYIIPGYLAPNQAIVVGLEWVKKLIR